MRACYYLSKLFPLILSIFFVSSASAFTCTEPTNVALASNGATATASSAYSGFAASGAINGDRKGLFVWQNGYWSTASAGFPAWLEVQFNGSKTITEIDVVTSQDNYNAPIEPTESTTFTAGGLTAYEVQYWNGSAWATITGGSVNGNNKVWKKFSFAAVTTTKIRVLSSASPDNYSRLTEVEAWTGPSPAPRYNLALGATATASSNWSGWPPSSCVNGDRKSLNAGSNGGWVDAAPANSFPDWLQVDFGANKTINEVDVFTLQDNYAGSSEPTESMTFTQWGLTSYQVEYWNGSSWVAISGASVTGNNKIWRKFSFSPISTSKIRVLTSASVDGYSRITEVEAYAPQASSCQGISRLDPLNATGGGGENPLSQNFNWNVPLVSLPGRAGLDLDLALSYNSLVWTKNGTYISFNEDNGWPGPGFRLGFPVIQQLHYNGETGKYGFILISPDGSRTELRQVGTSVFFEAADSSHLLLDTTDMTLRAADGTQLSYQLIGNQFNCTQIKDRNGNLITTEYVAGRLDKVIDTLGRQIKFNYDGAGLLTSITQTWNQGQPNQASHKWAEFAYTDTTIQTNFVNLTVSGPANNTTIKTLSKVTLADNSHFDFSYTSWGQVWKVTYIASDNVNHVLNYRAYNLPGSPLQASSAQADCPRFTQRRDWVKYWNGDVDGTIASNEEAVTTFSGPVNDTWTMPGDSQTVSGKRTDVTLPDGTVNKTYFVDASGTPRWSRGLPALVETSTAGGWQRKVKTTWTQDNTSADYLLNPRVIEKNVYDPAGNRARTEITYEQFTFANNLSCWLPKDLREYAGDAATVLRTTRTNYNTSTTYTDRRILGLPSEELLYEGTVAGTLMSKTEFSYDESGSIPTNDAPIQHDTNYHWTFLARGNLTRVRRYDVSNLSQSTSTTMKYNTAGAVVSSKDASDHQVLISYADSYSDGNNSRGTLAYPTTFTDADGYSSTTKYSFDFGGVTYTRNPQPNGTSNAGPEETFTFDSIGRLQQVTNLVNNAYTRFVYVASQLKVERYTTIESGLGESLSFQVVDGVGRTIASASDHPGSTGGYSGQKFVYDVMGRVIKTSNPTETSASGTPFQWNTVGDDASAGWIYTQQTYDWKNRPRVTTNQDGTTKTILYAGCGCAGGQVTTLSDEGTIDGGIAKRRQKKIYSDVLGRTVKTEYLNWEGGSVYSATVQTYNARNQVTLSRQYVGPEGSGTYQDTTMEYDGYGRLKKRHVPEQDENLGTTWAYNDDDTLQSVTDARGASTHFSYNSRHLLTGVAWSVPQSSTIPTPPTVTYAYDGAGNRTSMMDAFGTVVYDYDSLSRMRSETRTLTGVSNPDSADGKFKLSYDYNLAGHLRKITDASNVSISYGHDAAGRVNSVTGSDSLYANVTQYAGAFSYRAWGALKSMTDGTNTVTSRTYNSRLQTQQFVLGNITQNYSYFNDGRIKFVQNLPDSNFDRSFSYDQQARLVSAMSGGAARQDAGSVPYQETFGYDVFSNLNARLTSTWNQYSANDSAVYVNNRRSSYGYDADGRNTAIEDRAYYFDAAGRNMRVEGPMWIPALESFITVAMDSGYDGDGQKVKEVTWDYYFYNPTVTTYYLRSTVLDGAIVGEINSTGQKQVGYVYLNGRLLARQSDNEVTWKHASPAGTSLYGLGGSAGEHFEFEPLGGEITPTATAPPENQQAPGEFSGGHFAGIMDSRFSNIFNTDGCVLDGAPVSCGIAASVVNFGTGQSGFQAGLGFNMAALAQSLPVQFAPTGNLTTTLNVSGTEGRETYETIWGDYLNQWVPHTPTAYSGTAAMSISIIGGAQQGAGRLNPVLPPARPIDMTNYVPPPLPFCGINPITGTPGWSRRPVGETGHLRPAIGGQGQFRAPRPRNDPPIHRGVDISGTLNETPVLANRDGTVHFAGNTGGDGGWLVEIDHAGGTETGYVHLQANSIPADVVAGGQVTQGQRIGTLGNTGNAGNTPPHLHFRARRIVGNQRQIIDPEEYLNSPCP